MSENIRLEWDFLLQTIKLGIGITLVYDGLRVLRMLIPHPSFLISLEDLLFWLGCTGAIFRLQFEQNDGISRGFAILGILLGMVIYNQLAGKWLIKLAERVVGFLKRGLTRLKKIFRIVLCKQKKYSGCLRSRYGKEGFGSR